LRRGALSVGGGAGEAVEEAHTELRKGACDLELRCGGKGRTRRLLTIAQGRVEDLDLSHLVLLQSAAATGSGLRAGSGRAAVRVGTSRLGSHGIIWRSRRPTCSSGCSCSLARCA